MLIISALRQYLVQIYLKYIILERMVYYSYEDLKRNLTAAEVRI